MLSKNLHKYPIVVVSVLLVQTRLLKVKRKLTLFRPKEVATKAPILSVDQAERLDAYLSCVVEFHSSFSASGVSTLDSTLSLSHRIAPFAVIVQSPSRT